MEESNIYTGKSVEEALESAISELNVSREQIEYEVLEKESNGFLGLFNNKPARISVKLKEKNLCDIAVKFLTEVLKAMDVQAEVDASINEAKDEININLNGSEMGVLIGKRVATLDSLQYLVSLIVNKESETYIKIKLDTENYRSRRKETLENLAHNIASRVKKTRHNVTLEPMNPYERRIIHSCLQGDSYVETHSEGEEPFRKVVITLKKGVYIPDKSRFRGGKKTYGNGNKNKKVSSSREFHKKYGADTKDYSTDYKKDYAEYLESKAAAKAAAEKNENV